MLYLVSCVNFGVLSCLIGKREAENEIVKAVSAKKQKRDALFCYFSEAGDWLVVCNCTLFCWYWFFVRMKIIVFRISAWKIIYVMTRLVL